MNNLYSQPVSTEQKQAGYISYAANTLAIKINRFIPLVTFLANYYKFH